MNDSLTPEMLNTFFMRSALALAVVFFLLWADGRMIKFAPKRRSVMFWVVQIPWRICVVCCYLWAMYFFARALWDVMGLASFLHDNLPFIKDMFMLGGTLLLPTFLLMGCFVLLKGPSKDKGAV